MHFASNFFEIQEALQSNTVLRNRMVTLIKTKDLPGKALEGGARMLTFCQILIKVTESQISLKGAYLQAETELPRRGSEHAESNKVFPQGWAERLVRTQLSRFYNEAVLEELIESGTTVCYVPHSDTEKADSKCTVELAGRKHQCVDLLQGIRAVYERADFRSKLPKLPSHPHCTHVVTPVYTTTSAL